MSDTEWLTVQDIADELDVGVATVRRWIRAGDIPVLDLGGPRAGYRIKREDFDAFINARYGRLGKAAA